MIGYTWGNEIGSPGGVISTPGTSHEEVSPMTTPHSTRVCRSCHRTKPTADFDRQFTHGKPNGYQPRCRDCRQRPVAAPLPGEEWRPVTGYEGWYEVSNLGRVRRVRPATSTSVGHVLRGKVLPKGYQQITLSRAGGQRQFLVHQLVAAAFIGPCPVGHEVNHKDFNRLNQRADNLEYKTHLANVRHTIAAGRARNGTPLQLSDADVLAIRASAETKADLARRYGVNWHTIDRIVKRRTLQHVEETMAPHDGNAA